MFKTPYLRINEDGIDLIKNYSVDHHIDYQEIKGATLTQRFLLEKWWTTFIIGSSLALASLVWGLFMFFNWEIELGDPRLSRRDFLGYLVTPVLLFTGGVLMVIVSLKKSPGLVLEISDQQIWLPIKEIEEEGRAEELIFFLKKRVDLKIKN